MQLSESYFKGNVETDTEIIISRSDYEYIDITVIQASPGLTDKSLRIFNECSEETL